MGDRLDESVMVGIAAPSVTVAVAESVSLATDVAVDEGIDIETSVELSAVEGGSEVSVGRERSEVSIADAGNFHVNLEVLLYSKANL